ncbi:MAG: DUF5615 family PIN-like protein, partial [Cyanobacteria bacterium J06558_2]
MSLRLLIDEDSQDKVLIRLLRKAGHDVITVKEADLMNQPDTTIFCHGMDENRIVLTRNCQDFKDLHEANPNHPGILAVYQEANSWKNMSFKIIVKAIFNLENANVPIANQFISL